MTSTKGLIEAFAPVLGAFDPSVAVTNRDSIKIQFPIKCNAQARRPGLNSAGKAPEQLSPEMRVECPGAQGLFWLEDVEDMN